MEIKNIIEDTEQIKRMKEYALSTNYGCSGEIYKLLSSEVLHNLVKKIKRGNVKFISNLLYEKGCITAEENFILILDKYIGYVRDNYLISHVELILILEETLKNKYSKCLLSKKSFYEHYDYYMYNFKLMFLYNFINNVKYLSDLDRDYQSIQKANKYINTNEIKNIKYLNEIECFFKGVINNRKNNIYNCFIYNREIINKHINFYSHQIDWVLDDYYKKNF